MSSSQLSSKSAPVQRNVTDTDTEPTSAPAQNTTNTNNASRNRFPSTQFSSIRSNHNPTIYPFSRVNPEGKSISSPLIVATSSNTTNSTANSAGNGRESVAVPPSFQDAAATAATDASETNKGQRNKKPPSQQQHHQHHSLLPSRVKFCQWNVIGCINCRSPPSHSLPSLPLDSDDQPPRKKQGPLLLELRQLTTFHNPTTTNNYNHPDSHAPNVATGLFANTVLCQSRGNPSLGASVTSTCLDFMSSDSSNLSLLPPPCATGLTSGALCIHTFAAATTTNELASPTAAAVDPSSRVLLSPWLSPTVDYYHMPRHQRPASAVAWRSNHRSHVAIGYGQSGTQASVSTTASTASGGGSNNNNNPLDRSRRLLSNTTASGLNAAGPTSAAAAANASSGGGDREYCCFLWDVEHQAQPQQQPHSTTLGSSNNNVRGQTSPLYKLSHAAGVASLGWILENGQTLVVGGQHRYLQLYDLRNASTTAPPVATVLSHTLGVHAIEVDPTRPSFFATYSRTAVGEPIKLWDARHLESPWSEIKIGGFTALTAVANSVQWSTLHPGILSVAVGDILQEYDTVSSTSRPILVNSVKMPKPILDFAHYPFDKLKDSVTRCGTRDAEQEVFAELFPKRIVAVDCDLSINAIAAHRIAPLAVSHRTGQVINSLNRTMLTSCPNPIATERSGIQSEEDISATMLRRARCHNITKYSMKTSSNIAIISKELKEVQSSKALIASSKTTEELLRLWKWIHRAESLCNETADDAIDVVSKGWSAKGLIDSGVWTLLESDDKTTEQKTMSDSLSCVTYDSSGRRAALAACGWAGVFDLSTVTAECENSGEFERSAALALWYGDIGGAVDALQRGADETTQTGSSSTAMYHETLELVSLSLAGYRGGGDSSRSFSSVWRKACEKLLLRPNLSDPVLMPSGARYLRHILQFLITIGIDDRHEAVMSDAMLSICDRVAFGCRFLPRTDLASFLDQCVQHCKDTGNVEGIAVTGLDKQGILILQSFVDSTSDVQTAALVTSRVIFPPDWTTERRVHAEWLSAYRSLLNRWQMWQSRAMFDVDRADLLRKVKMRLMASTSNITNNNSNIINDGAHGNINGKPLGRRVMTAGGRRAGGARGGVDLDVQVAVPAQLDARCNYCSAPLALRRRPDSQQPDQWLSKMKSVLPCCPQCRKALPRCAICMLSLGVLNPYMELAKERPRIGPRTSVTGGPSPMPAGVSYLHQQLQQHPDDLSSVSNLPFAEWFSWCLRCKHGGHAHHMVGWFAKHDVCPVSGCNCPCQFDEIHTLPRPFLP